MWIEIAGRRERTDTVEVREKTVNEYCRDQHPGRTEAR